MPTILSAGAGFGKTTAALKISFASNKDVLKINVFFGGEQKKENFQGAKNLKGFWTNCSHNDLRLAREILKCYRTSDQESKNLFRKMCRNGDLLYFQGGKYVQSSLHPVADKILSFDLFTFDEDLSTCSLEKAVYFFLTKDEEVYPFFRAKFLTNFYNKEKLLFDGLPYVRFGESAVPFPKSFVYPKSLREDKNFSSKFEEQINQMIAKSLSDKIKKEPDAFEKIKIMRDKGYSLAESLKISKEFDDVLDLIECRNGLLPKYPYAERSTKDIEVIESESNLVLVDKYNHCFYTLDVKTIVFQMGLCLIESINSAVQGGNSAAMEGGFDSGFYNLLSDSNHSMCVLFYAPKTSELYKKDKGDILAALDLKQALDGYIYIRKQGNFLSQCDWFLTSRNEPNRDRDKLYYLYDSIRNRSFGRLYSFDISKQTFEKRDSFFGEDNAAIRDDEALRKNIMKSIPGFSIENVLEPVSSTSKQKDQSARLNNYFI